MFQVGDQVSKVNVGGKTGSAKVYEIATVIPVSGLDEFMQGFMAHHFPGTEFAYTVRKVGGKGKGGAWYSETQLTAAQI